MSIDQTLSRLAGLALGRVIGREPWAMAQLAPHAGKQIAIALAPFNLTLAIDAQGNLRGAAADAPDQITQPNVKVVLKQQALLASTAQRLQHVRIEGDASLAHALGDLAGNLRFDLEHELSGVIGPVAGHRLAQSLQTVLAAMKEHGGRLLANAVEYVAHEDPLITPRAPFSAFTADTRALRDQIERLAKRIEMLEEK